MAILGNDAGQPAGSYIRTSCDINAVFYEHLKAGLSVGLGQKLSQWGLIAYGGSFGNSTEPQLSLHMVSVTGLSLNEALFSGQGIDLAFEKPAPRGTDRWAQ